MTTTHDLKPWCKHHAQDGRGFSSHCDDCSSARTAFYVAECDRLADAPMNDPESVLAKLMEFHGLSGVLSMLASSIDGDQGLGQMPEQLRKFSARALNRKSTK